MSILLQALIECLPVLFYTLGVYFIGVFVGWKVAFRR
jgi:hypothetical protein